MIHIFQVGAGSGGMPVLDLVARDPRVGRITLVEPDVYKTHNVVRHLFAANGVGSLKAELARQWLAERRPDLEVNLIIADLLDGSRQSEIEAAAATADIGICAADNEPAKYHFDALMRRLAKPWTLGEVLSGGIGGFIHGLIPGGPCYGCVASHLKRAVEVEKPKAPDYSQPGATVEEAAIPASRASISAIASLHSLITLDMLEKYTVGNGTSPLPFTSLLLTLKSVPDVFAEPFRPFRFRIDRSPDCLICRTQEREVAAEELDVALHEALARLGHD